MKDIDTEIRAAVDRTVSTAPPPVPVETILARSEGRKETHSWSSWRWAIAIPSLAAVIVVLAVPRLYRDDPAPGRVVDVETTDAIENDQTEPRTRDSTEITISEGLWLSETIPQIADQLPHITASQLWDALEQLEPASPVAPATSDLEAVRVPGLTAAQLRWEGLLAPGTYSIDADDRAVDVIDRMNNEFVRLVVDLGYQQAPATLGLTPYEVVVVASLVEAEDPADDADRAKIARVLHNRIGAGLPLGLDSSYPYAAQDRNLEVTASMLDTPGPYGLRIQTGLPPTPVTTPSEASLRAAIDPAPGPWLFYVLSDEQGNYLYASTIADHGANVALAHQNGMLD